MNRIKSGGRPTKELSKKRTYVISVKLNTREFYSLKAKAKSAGMSRSELVRRCITGSAIKPRLTPELHDHIRKLSGMGNNLNQLARKAHVEGYVSAGNECILLANKIDNVILLIKNDSKDCKG